MNSYPQDFSFDQHNADVSQNLSNNEKVKELRQIIYKQFQKYRDNHKEYFIFEMPSQKYPSFVRRFVLEELFEKFPTIGCIDSATIFNNIDQMISVFITQDFEKRASQTNTRCIKKLNKNDIKTALKTTDEFIVALTPFFSENIETFNLSKPADKPAKE